SDVSPEQRLGGLIGMDVLRSCVLAFDDQKFVARCLSSASLAGAPPPRDEQPVRESSVDVGALRSSARRRSIVQVGIAGVVMRPRADGGYDWIGTHLAARIRPDGTLSFFEAPPSGEIVHTQMDRQEERRWFEEQVGGLLVTLLRAKERELIL